MKHIPSDRFRIILFEEQIKKDWEQTLSSIYEYLGLDPTFVPKSPDKPVHRSWGWTRVAFHYYASKLSTNIGHTRLGVLMDKYDILSSRAIKAEDIEFLRSIYSCKNCVSHFSILLNIPQIASSSLHVIAMIESVDLLQSCELNRLRISHYGR